MKRKTKNLYIFIAIIILIAIFAVFYTKNQRGVLQIKTSAEKITVFIDNQAQTSSENNHQFNLKKGEHAIVIAKKNCWPWTQKIQIEKQKTNTLQPFFVPQNSSGVFIPEDDAEYRDIMALFQKDLISSSALTKLKQSQASFENISALDFYKDRQDIVIIATENGIYALGISSGKIQNFQPIYKGTNPVFVKNDNTSLYILDGDNLMLVNY